MTCLIPKDNTENMVVNHSDKTKKISKKRKGAEVFDYAPGEGFIPSRWCREKNFDTSILKLKCLALWTK